MDVPTFDQLHVVSDLHMGGEDDFQIFREGKRLAALIEDLAGAAENQRVALVLNGDIVDFLAEEPPCYLDPQGAIEKLKRICTDVDFAPVWDALRVFVNKAGRYLVLNLGNHDVELALPHVQRWLVNRLSDNEETQARITMATDGAGYRCAVGDKQVLCLHGNEVDGWNPVDFHQLLNVTRALNRGKPTPKWDANAGTRLVIDIMNGIKRHYRFVDLLKPETRAVIPTLVALEPKYLKEAGEILLLWDRAGEDKVRLEKGFLASPAEAAPRASAESDPLLSLLRESFGAHPDVAQPGEIDALLNSANDRIERGIDPMDGLAETSGEALGLLDDIRSELRKWRNWFERNEREALRSALLTWVSDDLYALNHADEVFRDLDRKVGPELDYLIAGHTHLARARRRLTAEGYYYNCGTWAGLIQLRSEILNSSDRFAQVFDKFKDGSLQAIDDLIRKEFHVVSIERDRGGVRGQLNLVEENGKRNPVPDTLFA